MREIKFRVWDMQSPDKKYHKMMAGHSFLVYADGRVFSDSGWDFVDAGCDITEKVVLMQFTGLHDKNGKEIYEGDFLRCENLEAVVEWSDDIAELGWILNSDGKSISWGGVNEHFEIVGNIYESPELMEAERGKD